MKFDECVLECAKNADLVAQYNRLYNAKIGIDDRKPIERMIDEATGYESEIQEEQKKEYRKFVAFVWEIIWLPLVAQS